MTQATDKSGLLDQSDSFGWVSIVVHWLTTAIIISLWFIGHSITEQDTTAAIDARRSLHVTIALSAWLLLLFRIIWRLRMHHPHADGQSLFIHRFARTVHYVMLAGISVMMLSGPVMFWIDDKVFTDFARATHTATAGLLFVLVLLHIGGSLKHMMFHEDDTIVRMLWPKKRT